MLFWCHYWNYDICTEKNVQTQDWVLFKAAPPPTWFIIYVYLSVCLSLDVRFNQTFYICCFFLNKNKKNAPSLWFIYFCIFCVTPVWVAVHVFISIHQFILQVWRCSGGMSRWLILWMNITEHVSEMYLFVNHVQYDSYSLYPESNNNALYITIWHGSSFRRNCLY